jgi:hypothetical protein
MYHILICWDDGDVNNIDKFIALIKSKYRPDISVLIKTDEKNQITRETLISYGKLGTFELNERFFQALEYDNPSIVDSKLDFYFDQFIMLIDKMLGVKKSYIYYYCPNIRAEHLIFQRTLEEYLNLLGVNFTINYFLDNLPELGECTVKEFPQNLNKNNIFRNDIRSVILLFTFLKIDENKKRKFKKYQFPLREEEYLREKYISVTLNEIAERLHYVISSEWKTGISAIYKAFLKYVEMLVEFKLINVVYYGKTKRKYHISQKGIAFSKILFNETIKKHILSEPERFEEIIENIDKTVKSFR